MTAPRFLLGNHASLTPTRASSSVAPTHDREHRAEREDRAADEHGDGVGPDGCGPDHDHRAARAGRDQLGHLRPDVDPAAADEQRHPSPESGQQHGGGRHCQREHGARLGQPHPRSPWLEQELVAHRAGVPVGPGEGRADEHEQAHQDGDHAQARSAHGLPDLELGAGDVPLHLGSDARAAPGRVAHAVTVRMLLATPDLALEVTALQLAVHLGLRFGELQVGEGRVVHAVPAKTTIVTSDAAGQQHHDRPTPAQPGQLDGEEPDHRELSSPSASPEVSSRKTVSRSGRSGVSSPSQIPRLRERAGDVLRRPVGLDAEGVPVGVEGEPGLLETTYGGGPVAVLVGDPDAVRRARADQVVDPAARRASGRCR